jgi:hypothetical protein
MISSTIDGESLCWVDVEEEPNWMGKLRAFEHLRSAGSEPCVVPLKMIAAVPGFTRTGGPRRLVDADSW